MKKLLLVLMFSVILIGCEISNEPHSKMEELAEPITVKIPNVFGINTVDVLATHRYVMNTNETLYYVPEVVKTNGETFINEKFGYVIKLVEDDKETWTLIKEEQAEKIVR